MKKFSQVRKGTAKPKILRPNPEKEILMDKVIRKKLKEQCESMLTISVSIRSLSNLAWKSF